jgi:putative PIN family toxin of toxin-antitoxin system
MKVVLDSNILLVTIGKRSRYRPVWDAFVNGKFHLVISEDIVHEYEEILLEHAAAGAAEIVLEIFIESPYVIFRRIYYQWNAISSDPDDNKFFDIAIAANADYLVTDDTHFNEAKNLPFPSVNIVTGDEFLKILQDTRDIEITLYDLL